MRAVRAVIAVVAFAALATSCTHTDETCPWTGAGSTTLTIEGGGTVIGDTASGNCSSGAYLNDANHALEATICGARFGFTVSLAADDHDIGARTLGPEIPIASTAARIEFTAETPDGNASYESESNNSGTFAVTQNYFRRGDEALAGELHAVTLALRVCTATSCPQFPARITLTGQFRALAH